MVACVSACPHTENMSWRQIVRILPLDNQLFYLEASVCSGEPASLFILSKFLIYN